MGESDCEDTRWRIDRFVQSLSVLGLDLARETGLEQGCEAASPFAFLKIENQNSDAANYYRQKLLSYRPRTDLQDLQFRNRIKRFVASKADLIFKLKGKERLRCGIDYNVDTVQEAYNVFATQLPAIESGMQVSSVARRAQIFELLKIGDIILGKVVGKRPFGIFVRILSLVHGRNLDFDNIDIQALCRKSELENDHKSREHLDPIDDFDVDDMVQGVICSISRDEERIAISFRSAKLPSEYGNIELGVIEDLSEKSLRSKSFDDDLDYNDYLKKDPGFSNPTNVQTLIDVLGVDCKPPNSLLRSCQRWTFNDEEAENLRKQQSKKWSMDTTAIGVGSFKSGDHEKALKYFNHALQIYEGNSEALVARGALYANQNKLEYAIKDFKEALVQHPKHHNAAKYLKETLFEKALRLKDIGNIREAISAFEEILGLDPNDTESQKQLKELKSVLPAKLVEESNKSRKAEGFLPENRRTFEHVRKLIKSDPDVVKRSRKKKRKTKKKKLKKVKSKKRRRRSEISHETTSTASETGASDARDSDDDEWVEKDKSSYSPRKDERVGHVSGKLVDVRPMLSNISAKSVDFSSQSNLFQEVHTPAKDRSFESCSSVSMTQTQHGMDILIDNVVDTSCGVTAAGVSYNTEGHLGEDLESAGGRERGGEGVERRRREKAREGVKDFKQTRNESNENEGSRRERFRRRGSHSRSRSRSYEKKYGSKDSLERGNAKALGARRLSGKNTSESDVDNGKKVSRRTGRSRSRGSRSRTRSTDDNGSSDRTRRRRSLSRSNDSVKRTEYIRRNRSTSSSESSERNRTRNRSCSLNQRRISKEQRNISRDSRRRQSSSKDSRERSGSRDSRRRWSSTMNRKGRRRASRDGSGRSGSGNSRGRRSSSKDSRRRRSTSRDSSGRPSESRSNRGRRIASSGSRRRWSSSGDRRRWKTRKY